MSEGNFSKRVLLIRERFLEYLANGRYREAESFLVTLRINAKRERDADTYYAVTYLLGVCYQQEGRLKDATRSLSESSEAPGAPILAIRAKLHLGKVHSQAGDYSAATEVLANTLTEIEVLENESRIISQEAADLKLPILWRLGVEETLIGNRIAGEQYKSLHEDLSGDSPYQIANALASRVILFAGGGSGTNLENAQESLQEASDTYVNAPENQTTSFAFRDKAFIGMILLESVLDYHAERKFSAYIKLHLVRHYMILWGILPSSEGFAEMIRPALSTFPQLLQFLSLSDRTYERWISRQADAKVYLESRGYAAELIRIMETAGKTGYRTELSSINTAVLGRGKKVFSLGPQSFELLTRIHSLRSPMQLIGSQRKELCAALIEAFPSRAKLRQIVRYGLDENIEAIAGGENLIELGFNLIEWSEANGRTAELIVAARNENPGNLALRSVAEELELAPSSSEVESIILKSVGFTNVAEWRDRMIKSELCVCRVENASSYGIGTAFLVGPDLVITNYHVIEEVKTSTNSVAEIVLRFDYKKSVDGSTIETGKTYELVKGEWLLDHSPSDELDYALIRVEGKPGNEPIAGQQSAPPRGWLTPETKPLKEGDPLLIIQHPQAEPLKLAVGSVLEVMKDGRRFKYSANTLPGSSGSPCFTANWDLIGLHRAGNAAYNEGVPFTTLLSVLNSTGKQLLAAAIQ